MSLVVAQTTEDGPRIVSDTRVGFPYERRSNFKTGTLKVIVVTRKVAVCFAGDVSICLDGVRGFARRLREREPLDDAVAVFRELTSDSRRHVEFIVANADADSRLTRVRDGRIERALPAAWIGDQDAFERFQQERHKPIEEPWCKVMDQLPPGAKAISRLGRAMEAVIDDPAIASVDDFCVRVATKEGDFNYLEQTFVHVGRNITVRSGEDLIAKMAQPVEEGGYAVSVVEPSEPGTPALGLNFPRARIGMVYLPLEYDEAQVIHDVSPNDFARVVLDRFGVRLSDPLLKHP